MRKLSLSFAAVLVTLLVAAAPVGAITYGQPDAGEHPYVGFMIFYDPAEDAWFSCSGTLLDADTFLTAGHCTFGIGIEGAEPEDGSGGTDVWVTFDDTEVLAGWPLRSEIGTIYPDVAALNAARRAWLDDPAHGFVGGTAFPNPLWEDARFPVNYDVGVVELDVGVTMSTYGVLAALGTAETLAENPSGRNAALVETVGYGIQSVQPHPADIESRFKSTSRIVEINGSIARGGNLHTLNNPSPVGGVGGSCFGDSGGPVFVNNTNEVIAVVSFGFSLTCHGADYSWRVDTQPSYDFILPFLSM